MLLFIFEAHNHLKHNPYMLSHHDLLLTVQFSVYIFFSFHVYMHIHMGGYCVFAGEFAHVCAFM